MVFILVIVVFFIAARVAWQMTMPKANSTRARITFFTITGLALVPLAFFFMLVATDPGDNLVVVDAAFATTPQGVRVVAGAVENRTDRAYGNVQVQIDFLNAAGGVVGYSIAAVNTIPAGNAWSFAAPVDAEGAVGFRTAVDSPENRRPAWLGGCATTIC